MLDHSIVSQHFWNPKVQYRIHNSSPPVPILSQTIWFTSPHPTSPRSILISSTHLCLGLPSGSFPLAFRSITYMCSSSPHSYYMTRPSHPPRLDYSNYTWRRIQIIKPLVMQFSPSWESVYKFSRSWVEVMILYTLLFWVVYLARCDLAMDPTKGPRQCNIVVQGL
jgi:hypothetical protein